jgi:hypothetical protein
VITGSINDACGTRRNGFSDERTGNAIEVTNCTGEDPPPPEVVLLLPESIQFLALEERNDAEIPSLHERRKFLEDADAA